MHIKRLEIIGFKSFPDKCTIDFPAGISAIVGPNGCGKSNIIDSIKWVMGEQSIKQLRGKSMGDVIFSGTEKRPPLNMAEVSMTLSNDTSANTDDRFAQFTEIMITRRLYRSGESAYLINKQLCRLKDIHHVFLGSGMGARSCAIVQQGNIGAITDATPEERRTFIEEAAGVTRYKIRKNEAISKVTATNQNLLRLDDIIDEIKKQMNSLRRQARKALRYKDFRDGLKKSDMLVSVYYHEHFSGQMDDAQTLLSELKGKNTSHASELKKLDSALEKIKSDRVAREQVISERKSEKANAERQIETGKNELSYLKNEEKRLTEEIGDLETATRNLAFKNEKIDDEIAQESVKIKNLEIRYEETRVDLNAQVMSTSGIREALGERQKKLDAQKKALMALMTQKAKFQSIFQNAAKNKENLRQQLQRVQKEEADIAKRIKTFEQTVAEAEVALAKITDAAESVQRRIDEAKQRLNGQIEILGNQIKLVNTLAGERSSVKSEYLALKKMDDNFEWYKDGVKAVMKQLAGKDSDHPPSPRISGIIGIAADAIEPAPGYEIALEAALGEALQYIMINDQAAGVASIHYLKKSNTGRSGFIPIAAHPAAVQSSPLSEAHPEAAEHMDRALLINHVKIKSGSDRMLSRLLKDIAVADDFDAALKMCAPENGYAKIVTKDGDILTSDGIMVGGSQDKLSGIYMKKLALKTLGSRLAELDSDLEDARKKQVDLETAVKQLEVDIQKLTVQKNDLEKQTRDAEKQHFQASETLKHTRGHYKVICLERDKLVGEKTDIDEEIAAHDAALQEIIEQETGLEQAIQEMSDEINTLNLKLNDLSQAEIELKLTRTRLSAEIENAKKTLSRLKEYQTDGLHQMEQITNDILVKTQKSAQAAKKIVEADKKLATARDSLNTIDQELRNLDTGYQEIVAEIDQTDSTIQSTKTLMEEIQGKIHALELELSGLGIKRENVVNRFLERYSQSFSDCLNEHRETVLSSHFSIEKTEAELAAFRKKIDRIGDVNLGAIEAYDEQKTRYEFLVQQREDLVQAIEDLQSVIKKINRITQKLFMEMFENINTQFKAMFPKLFSGGSAWLELTQPNQPLETGVELMIHPPGKKVSRLSLLSGGEKALSAIAFIFSIFLINPASYCLLDEIDAPLDEANTNRFNELLKIIGEKSQIVMISHNKRSMEFSDMLFGVTMSESGVSKLVSVDIEKLSAKKDLAQ